jgi:hypothetical protein
MTDKAITLRLSKEFASFLEQVHRQHKITVDTINHPIIALDPGETTGVAEFDGDTTITVYQKATKDIGESYDWLARRLVEGPDIQFKMGDQPWPGSFAHLRVEDYRVYEWKASDHAWSPVHTIRWIGAIQVAAHLSDTPISFCMAQHAKGFWTDQKLNHFGINPKGLKHGRDALRHLLYYMLFPTKVDP